MSDLEVVVRRSIDGEPVIQYSLTGLDGSKDMSGTVKSLIYSESFSTYRQGAEVIKATTTITTVGERK